jgi:serine/threonine protein phosphatase PrpC
MRVQLVQSACTHAGYTASRPVAAATRSASPYTEDYLVRFVVDGTIWSCVFDGHGGDAVAVTCARLVEKLARECHAERETTVDALALLFSRIDAEITLIGHTESGSTCNVTVIDPRTGIMTVASLGDSRTLVYGPHGPRGPHALLFETTDQDCADQDEQRRLRDLGLFVFEHKVRTGAVVHSTGVYRCSTAGGRDLATMSSFGSSVHDVPRGAVNKAPRMYTFQLEESHVVVICSDGCMEHIAPYSASMIQTRPVIRLAEIAGDIQALVCTNCGRMFAVGAAMLADHITTSQIESMARVRGAMMRADRREAGAAGAESDRREEVAHREWVEREFDNQTVVAMYIGATCACSPGR